MKQTPSAYLGLNPAFATPTARICMSCPDKAEAEAYAHSIGQSCTHGLCPKCFDLEMIKIALYLEKEACKL